MEEDSIPVDIEPHYILIERHLYANRLIQRHHDSWRPIIKDQEWAVAQFLDILPLSQNSGNNPPSRPIKNLATTLYFQAVPIFWDRLHFVYQMCISQGVSPSERPTFCPYMECSVQSLSWVRLFATPWTAAHQASLSITNSWSLPKPMSIE